MIQVAVRNWFNLPQIQENVDPIKENVWNLGGKAQIGDEVCAILGVNARIIRAHFVINEILSKMKNVINTRCKYQGRFN